jgi:hypothetical protein
MAMDMTSSSWFDRPVPIDWVVPSRPDTADVVAVAVRPHQSA